MLYKWYQFTRLFYYPVFNWILPIFSKRIKERRKFENKNFKDAASQSFHAKKEFAQYCFEFSSEGEFEQVRPLIMKSLQNGERVELLFSSESVEYQCAKLYQVYPKLLRYRRLFLVGFNPLSSKKSLMKWISAKKFYMCRYDFFPELIEFGAQKHIEFILLWASTKSYQKAKSSFLLKKYYESVYKKFDKIIAATPLDHAQFSHELHVPLDTLEVYDFRPVQILKRIETREVALQNRIKIWSKFFKKLEATPKDKRIIYGSFWPKEVELFTNFSDETYLHVIVPHKLEESESIRSRLTQYFDEDEIQVIDEQSRDIHTNSRILIMNFKGVLCELYSYFKYAYVGGGFGVSVHSLMEAFLSDCLVVCGPRVTRSTEYDLISQSHPDHLILINRMEEFFKCISYKGEAPSDLHSFIQHYKGHYAACAMWIGLNVRD